MTTITISKTLDKNKELIAIPRRAYEEFLSWEKKVKSAKTFKPTAGEKRTLAIARKNFLRGNYVTIKKLKDELGINR